VPRPIATVSNVMLRIRHLLALTAAPEDGTIWASHENPTIKLAPDTVITLPTYPDEGERAKMTGDELMFRGTANKIRLFKEISTFSTPGSAC
jgi:hypothetical protein